MLRLVHFKMANISGEEFSEFIKSRRTIRDFKPDPIDPALLEKVLEDAAWAPSWKNAQPYFLAIASGEKKDRIKKAYLKKFDETLPIQRRKKFAKLKALITRKGLPDGDYKTTNELPPELMEYARKTGFGLYGLIGIDRRDYEARFAQFRRNFEFFGAPTVIFVFAHGALGEFGIQDAGIMEQTLMLSAHAHGLGTCPQGALATWLSPIKAEFEIPEGYKLVLGISIGYPTENKINTFNPGRRPIDRI